jgi:hypothetical protein
MTQPSETPNNVADMLVKTLRDPFAVLSQSERNAIADELSAAQAALAEAREQVIEECCQVAALSVNETDYIERRQVEKTIRAIRAHFAALGEGKKATQEPPR